MSYTPKTWTDRVVEKPMTYTVTNNPDGSITLTPAEGTVITAGDLVKAEYLNAMEQGIKSAHDLIAGIDLDPNFETTAANIKMDGTQSLGTLETVPRADHVHPTDTSRAPLASPTFTGTVVLPSTTSIGNVSSAELGYLDGVTSALQTQLNAKAPLASPALTGTPTAPSASGSTDTTQIATMAAVHDAIDADVGVANSADVKTALNAGGTAPIYACRAWVNFTGTGTLTVNASGNVSSVTDNGTGDYTVNFTTAIQDANFVTQYSNGGGSNNQGGANNLVATTTSVRVISYNPTTDTLTDSARNSVAVFR
jgi:hypothetical protein